MLIDDNPDHADLAADCLSACGADINVGCYAGAETALEALAERSTTSAQLPDLILLDINLPGLSGFDVLRSVKTDTRLCRIPTIMLSSSADPNDILRACKHHANSYITKSADFTRWEAALRAICDYWRHHDRAYDLKAISA
ncbi:MAG: response regulator [Pseudomonadota bacterium]